MKGLKATTKTITTHRPDKRDTSGPSPPTRMSLTFFPFQAFVSCGWGISNIGFVMICFGVCNGLAAIFTGSIVKITGRNPVICFALSLHVALIVTLLVWRPTPDGKLIFFVISGLWGICDAVWLVQINCELPDKRLSLIIY